ncbi:MAG: hydroxyacid dehydrogenase, partial [Pseudomonadota bacterium]|nr:hydroxyacid dehydrogenase [Pseudomonadota bacterium]
RQGPVTAAVMDAAPMLRVVARHGVGVDDVDVAEAGRRGIVVTRAPGSNTRAVAEHTIAMILALAKRLPMLSAQVAAGEWRRGSDMVRDIAGLRLGLVGLGSIGQAVARLASGFDMEVAAYTRSPGPEQVTRMPDLPALLARSDVLSLHLPYSPAVRHLIGRVELALLPAGAMVINTARGGLIDETALLAALDSSHLSGAGLDVFEGEPPALDNLLRRHPAVIATPHVSGVTEGSLVTMGVMAAECIVAVLTDRPVPPERLVHA